MKVYLKNFKSIVTREEDVYRVHYFNGEYTGECVYKMTTIKGQKKPIEQKILVLTDTEMGDVIEGIHKLTPLSGGDHNDLSMEIKVHSRKMVEEFIS